MEILKKTPHNTRLMWMVISHCRVFHQLTGRSLANNEETTDPVFTPEFRAFQMSVSKQNTGEIKAVGMQWTRNSGPWTWFPLFACQIFLYVWLIEAARIWIPARGIIAVGYRSIPARSPYRGRSRLSAHAVGHVIIILGLQPRVMSTTYCAARLILWSNQSRN